MFNRFKDDLKKYWKYAIYSSDFWSQGIGYL